MHLKFIGLCFWDLLSLVIFSWFFIQSFGGLWLFSQTKWLTSDGCTILKWGWIHLRESKYHQIYAPTCRIWIRPVLVRTDPASKTWWNTQPHAQLSSAILAWFTLNISKQTLRNLKDWMVSIYALLSYI